MRPHGGRTRADANSTHPLGGDLYTPINEDILKLLWRMRDKHETWREVAYLSGMKLKVLRRLRKDPNQRTISMTTLDNLITTTGVGDLRDYVWFTADDLVALGLWKQPADLISGFPTVWKGKRKRY